MYVLSQDLLLFDIFVVVSGPFSSYLEDILKVSSRYLGGYRGVPIVAHWIVGLTIVNVKYYLVISGVYNVAH